jgi:hypothetical protein
LTPSRKACPCSNGATTPKQSNTAKSFSNRLLFGDDEQGEDITRILSTTFPSSDYEVDAPCTTATNKPSATTDAQFEQVSWASGVVSTHSILKGQELSPTSPPPGLVGRLQTEVRILQALSEIPRLPLSFEDSMELAGAEGNQKVLSTFLKLRIDHEDHYPTKPKQVKSCNDLLNYYPSKLKQVRSFETASTCSSLVSDETTTRFYRDRRQEQPQINGALSLTDIFSWSNKGEIKTVSPTVSPTVAPKKKKARSTSSKSNFCKSKKSTKSKRGKSTIIDLDTGHAPSGPIDLDTGLPSVPIDLDTGLPSGPIDLDTGLPPNCNQDDFDESCYSLQPPSMIESSCSSSSEEGERNSPLRESRPLQPVPFLNRSIKSKSSPSQSRLQGSSWDSRRYGEC